MKTAAVFVGGMAAGAGLLYFGLAAYLSAEYWMPRRWYDRPGRHRLPIQDQNLPDTDEEWGPTR
jgi:hypothetical protein